MKTVVSLVLLLLWCTAAWSGEIDCSGTQAEMNRCAANSFEAESKVLEEWYRRALEQAQDKEAMQMLAEAQETWLAFREAQCEYDGDLFRGGSMRPLMVANCKTSMTQGRIAQLQTLVETGYGTVSGFSESLQRFLQQHEDNLPTGIYWNNTGWVAADLDGDGDYDEAFLGVLPGTLLQPELQYVVGITFTGTKKLYWDTFTVGGDELCSPEAELRTEYLEGELPFVVLDDHACDAFRFQVQEDGMMKMLRN